MIISQKYTPITRQTNGSVKADSEERYLQLSYISAFIFFFLGIPMMGYILLKYYGRDPYGDFALSLLMLGLTALIGVAIVRGSKITHFQTYYFEGDGPFLFVLFIVIIVALLSMSWFFLGLILRYALDPIDLYFYYLAAAIMEEMFFRFFLCGVSKKLLSERTKLNEHLQNSIIAVFTAVAFMLAHYEYYGKDPVGMGAMFLGGIIFALFYLYTKDIAITMIAHLIVNYISVGNMLAQYAITSSLFITFLLCLVCILLMLFCLEKYKKTSKKRFLILFIVLAFPLILLGIPYINPMGGAF